MAAPTATGIYAGVTGAVASGSPVTATAAPTVVVSLHAFTLQVSAWSGTGTLLVTLSGTIDGTNYFELCGVTAKGNGVYTASTAYPADSRVLVGALKQTATIISGVPTATVASTIASI